MPATANFDDPDCDAPSHAPQRQGHRAHDGLTLATDMPRTTAATNCAPLKPFPPWSLDEGSPRLASTSLRVGTAPCPSHARMPAPRRSDCRALFRVCDAYEAYMKLPASTSVELAAPWAPSVHRASETQPVSTLRGGRVPDRGGDVDKPERDHHERGDVRPDARSAKLEAEDSAAEDEDA